VFERLFKERGLPVNIRSDNGVPFASAHALFNLSKLAVWWLRLGIGIERIKPGHPHQNGRHVATDAVWTTDVWFRSAVESRVSLKTLRQGVLR
jgi:hypothetical protein